MFKDKTTLELLQELEQKLRTKEIFFWIDNQDCYLLEWTIHYTNKIKVGDLSLTKENYFKELEGELWRLVKEKDERSNFLNIKFQEISDVEIIEELSKRVKRQDIKLSMYPQSTHVSIEGKDITNGIITTLPIEKKGDNHE
ncbi:hypothetical protein [endosymbiont GvMRE of Glomus versiforme]|uniref:hypothetical protein n=1 Tax=endosymbiont GvMRE of Glomus versiforme TaxID=2039283 RepID=UPI000EC1F235|nr:hypothetical protein [endosymbiont GvMRE of Glomus versiforme]RHZ36728.1 hypothetical protein GvMRE_I2g417 [endosymbiont GvMRE of Glomus versiforme]